jgi:N-acetylglutamate synthase-like GNAT family acetyltransferase
VATYATKGVSAPVVNYVQNEFTTPRIAASLSCTSRRFWVLQDSDGPVGFCDAVITDAGAMAEIARFYILENFCGKGHGRKFLTRISCDLFEEGVRRIWLSVWAKNSRAIRFYQKCEWIQVEDAHFMLDGEAHLNHVFQIERTL